MDWKPRNEYCPAIVVSKLFLLLSSSPAFCAFARPVKKFVAEFVQSLLGKQKQTKRKFIYTVRRLSWDGWDLAQWLDRLTDNNAEVAWVLGSIPASYDTVGSEGRQMKQCWIS